jgi:hypothetical protein
VADQTVKITDGKTLSSFLGAVFEEGIKSSMAHKALTEKEKQVKVANSVAGKPDEEPELGGGDVDSLFGGGDAGGDEGGGADAGGAEDAETNMPDDVHTDDDVEAPDDTDQKLKSGEVSVKDIVEKLNSIRSGKSFKDSAVSKAIDDYVAKLKKPERVALMSFLQGISQIVTGEVPGQAAVAPDAQPADVNMKKGNEPKTVQKKPNIIKGPGETSKAAPKPPGQTSMKPGQEEPEEDTTPPAPIVPKKRGG